MLFIRINKPLTNPTTYPRKAYSEWTFKMLDNVGIDTPESASGMSIGTNFIPRPTVQKKRGAPEGE